MVFWKKIGKVLLFPPLAVMCMLLPVATVFVICSTVFEGTNARISYIAYVLAAYTVAVWCARLPKFIAWGKTIKRENRYLERWSNDVHLRVRISLYGTCIWNMAYAVFQLCLGLYHASFWHCSMAAYYTCLAVMRFYLSRYTSKHTAGENLREELMKYRNCGIVFLILNLALSLMTFFMVYWNRTFNHHEITTIAMAAYTFTAFTFAVINIVKYRRYESPVYSASKAISLAAACVSMLTLTSTMLTTFGGANVLLMRRIMLGSLGGAISVFIVGMAIYMIVGSSKTWRNISIGEYHER